MQSFSQTRRSSVRAITLLFMLFNALGCAPQIESEVILESTIDQDIAAPILSAFHRAEKKLVQPRATFSADARDRELRDRDLFVKKIRSESKNASADLFWTDDVLLMLDLHRRGLLAPHSWKLEPTFPIDMRATDGTWCGFAADARVLVVNTQKLPDTKDHPQSIEDLVDPRWKGRCAMAMPTSGTTAIHVATIASTKGVDETNQWLAKIASNVTMLHSNSEVATAVAKGHFDWGLTDSSDAVLVQDGASPIAVVFPDQATSQPGTVRIPNLVAVLKNASHPIAASKLADYLILATTEDRLAMSDSASIPISRLATFKPRVLPDAPVRWANVDFEKAADLWPKLQVVLTATFPSESNPLE